MMRKRRHVKEEAQEDELDAPPVLQPEANNEEPPTTRFHQPFEYETYEEGQFPVDDNQYVGPGDANTIEFNFVDDNNVQCGICFQTVRYKTLFSDHINNQHPEYAGYTLEDEHYEQSLSYPDMRSLNKNHLPHFNNDVQRPIRSTRSLRKVSQIRVNMNEMSLEKLEDALRRKMVEKMGRPVPVTLVDKQHARCGICSAVLSLNRKFEIVHLVRHFNAWHPSAHKCSGNWLQKINEVYEQFEGMKPLGLDDFAVIDLTIGMADNLQCIWCGMFMDVNSLAMHFHEIHPEEVEVPKCRLCLQELVTNARFHEKYGESMEIRLPDEHHFKSKRFNVTTSSEAGLERTIKRLMKNKGQPPRDDDEEAQIVEEDSSTGPEPYSNSRMSFGKRNKPKRQFIMPSLRQATPKNSKYIHPVSECHWKCKLCGHDILAAVISAGAIRHFKQNHALVLEKVQAEICQARLEKISDGCMDFINPEEIECLICGMTYPLHRPYNMCRAIRHLKLKHPEQMPEYHATFAESNQEVPQDIVDDDGIEEALNETGLEEEQPLPKRLRQVDLAEEDQIDRLLEEPSTSAT